MAEVKLATKGWVAHDTVRDLPVRPAEVTIAGPMPDTPGMALLKVRIGEGVPIASCVLVPVALMEALREHEGREAINASIAEAGV